MTHDQPMLHATQRPTLPGDLNIYEDYEKPASELTRRDDPTSGESGTPVSFRDAWVEAHPGESEKVGSDSVQVGRVGLTWGEV